MNTGGFAQMSHPGFASSPGLGMPAGGLASRRGGAQNLKPLSVDASKLGESNDTGVPTPRTSRGHLLAGLRTAPKTATASYAPSPTMTGPGNMGGRNMNNKGMGDAMYGGQDNIYNHAPKTSMPRMASQTQQAYHQMSMGQHQQQQQQQQLYTTEQILAPPELHLDEQMQQQLDPNLFAQLVATNAYLAQQQQQLQQQLLNVQAAAQQFQGLSINGHSSQQQLALQNLVFQQQHLRNIQQSMASPTLASPQQGNIFQYFDPATGQSGFYMDQNAAQSSQSYMDQPPATPHGFGFGENNGTPRVQVSPPPADNSQPPFRGPSPPKRMELVAEPEPLPPPSANAFRRGHKKTASSLANNKGLSLATEDGSQPTGPRTATLPLTPMTGGYGPGQARAGEHPCRQPRGPPAMEELKAKPTSKDEGSKNFTARTRRSAVHNLVRAGRERRKGTGSSSGSMSPVSESAEETVTTPLTDHDSESGRSGSGSLSGDAEPSLSSSRTSASISWGAIGSDRPISRQKTRKSVDSLSSACESDGSFANVFKNGAQRVNKPETADGQRKAPRLVLTNAEKRKTSLPLV